MDKKDKKREEKLEQTINLGMVNIALSPMNMMSPVVPLILDDEEEKENDEDD